MEGTARGTHGYLVIRGGEGGGRPPCPVVLESEWGSGGPAEPGLLQLAELARRPHLDRLPGPGRAAGGNSSDDPLGGERPEPPDPAFYCVSLELFLGPENSLG